MLPLSFLALWASGFASEGPTIDRAASLGLSRVPSADGASYVYDLPDDVETPAYQTIGALRWKYDGQMRFGQTSGPASGLSVWVHPDRVLTDVSYDAAAYLGVGETVRLDKYGRRWVLAGYDEQALWRKLHAYDDLVEREFGAEKESVARQGYRLDPQAGLVELSVLDVEVWDNDICTTTVAYDIEDHWQGGTTTKLVRATSPNVRQKKTVLILGVDHAGGFQYMGSGVMVDSDTVLTAAHVIANSSGYTDITNLRVCTYGNVYSGAQCQAVDSMTTPGGTYDGSIPDDYAVMTLDAAWSSPTGWMAMSTASDTTLLAATHYHEGYPSHAPHCAWNSTYDDADTVVDGQYLGTDFSVAPPVLKLYDYFGAWLWSATGPAASAPTGYMTFNVSSGGGMSGGPYYYCPSGCTSSGGAHYITAITHGHAPMGVDMHTSGAKARDFRDWVIAHM